MVSRWEMNERVCTFCRQDSSTRAGAYQCIQIHVTLLASWFTVECAFAGCTEHAYKHHTPGHTLYTVQQ